MNISELILQAYSAHIRDLVCDCEPVTDGVFDVFFHKICMQKIAPMVFSALHKAGKLPLSENKFRALKNVCTQQIAKQIYRNNEFTRVASLFVQNGVDYVCVKGPACAALYPDPALRLSGDFDIVVASSDIGTAARILEDRGYASDPEDLSAFEIAFCDKNGNRIEMHRQLFDPNGVFSDMNELTKDLFASKRRLTAEYQDVFVPEENLHLLYLVLHAFKHFVESGIGIRQLSDIALFAASFSPDWPFLFSSCAKFRADVFLDAVLCIGAEYFGLDVSAIADRVSEFDASLDYSELLQDILSGSVYGADSIERKHSGTMTRNAFGKTRDKTGNAFWSSLFPDRKTMESKYPFLTKHSALLPAAWGHRIIKYAFSKNDKTKTMEIAEQRIALLKKYKIIKE